MGADSKFTPARTAAVLASLRAGVSVADACLPLDVSPGTVRNWLSRGRREQVGPFADFAAEVDTAREEVALRVAEAGLGEEDLLRLMEATARRGSVQAAKFLLERMDRESADVQRASPFDALDRGAGADDLMRKRQRGSTR
jgi:transposase-like protein